MNLESLRLIDQAIDATGGVWTSNTSRCRVQKTIITRAEFEARKTERQNKPDWNEHDYKFIHQGKNGHWYGSLKDNPASLPDIITDECWYYIEAASARRGEVFGDYRNTLEQRPSHIHQTSDLGRSSGTVGANHIGESDEKVSTYAEIQQAAQACERALNEFFPKVKLGDSVDWYDYDKQEATKLPPVGAVVNFEWGGYHRGAVEIVAYRNNGNTAVLWHVDRDAPDAAEVMSSSFRPLDWDRSLHPNPEPEPSPELSFHLSNAFNELQASARLLPDTDPRRAQIIALAGGVGAVKEVA